MCCMFELGSQSHEQHTLWCKTDRWGQNGGCEKHSRPVADRLLHRDVRRTWEVSWGASWDRTSTFSLCRREDPCLGQFVFSVLSPIPILPHPPFLSPEIALSLSWVSWVFYLLCANAVQSCLPIHLLAPELTSDTQSPLFSRWRSTLSCQSLLLFENRCYFTPIVS